MRAAGVLLEFCLQVLFLSNYTDPAQESSQSSVVTRSRSRRRSKRPRRVGRAAVGDRVVMVLSAIVQFLKRVCILVIGLFRLTYRKVTLLTAVDLKEKHRWRHKCDILINAHQYQSSLLFYDRNIIHNCSRLSRYL